MSRMHDKTETTEWILAAMDKLIAVGNLPPQDFWAKDDHIFWIACQRNHLSVAQRMVQELLLRSPWTIFPWGCPHRAEIQIFCTRMALLPLGNGVVHYAVSWENRAKKKNNKSRRRNDTSRNRKISFVRT